MFETLLSLGSSGPRTDLLLDIDFLDQNVGETSIIDKGMNGHAFTRRVSGTSGTPDGVVDHPTLGKSYYFNGVTSFLSGSIINVAKQAGDVEIDLEYIPMANPSYMTLMFTGGFSAGLPGWNHYIQPTNRANYSVLFVMQSSATGGFSSIITGLPGTVPLTGGVVKERIILKKATDTWTMANTNDGGVSSSAVRKLTNNESIFTIGADNDPALGKFTGYLKSIKARVIVA